MKKRISYEYEDKPLSGRNLFSPKPCHCEKQKKQLEKANKALEIGNKAWKLSMKDISLAEQVIEVTKVLEELDEYLSSNKLNKICSGSILHKKIIEGLGYEKAD